MLLVSTRATIPLNPLRDAPGNAFAKVSGFHAGTFLAVADEAAFDQNGGGLGVADDVVTSVFDAAVFCAGVTKHSALHIVGKLPAVLAVIEGFETADVPLPGGIVMHAYKDRISIAVGDLAASGKGNKFIAAASHHGFEAHGLEIFLQAIGGIECEVLFIHLAVVASFVAATMTRVDNDSAKAGSIGNEDAG